MCGEEAPELQPQHPQVVRLATRAPNIEGAGEVTLGDLVRQALRMRPDRLVVGEVRGPEVCELLAALNTGHRGGVGTRHALHSQLAAVVHVVRCDGARRPSAVGMWERDGDLVRVLSAWGDGRWGPGEQHLWDLLDGRSGGAVC